MVDLADVTFLDSAGVGALLRMYKRQSAAGRGFVLREPQQAVLRVLELTGVTDLVEVRKGAAESPERPSSRDGEVEA